MFNNSIYCDLNILNNLRSILIQQLKYVLSRNSDVNIRNTLQVKNKMHFYNCFITYDFEIHVGMSKKRGKTRLTNIADPDPYGTRIVGADSLTLMSLFLFDNLLQPLTSKRITNCSIWIKPIHVTSTYSPHTCYPYLYHTHKAQTHYSHSYPRTHTHKYFILKQTINGYYFTIYVYFH